jgi:RimJ/RimL family protein N-acetyltransferase
MDIQMRDVSLSDMGQILSWRNADACVRYSKSNSAISKSQHKNWFGDRILRNSREPYLIFTLNNEDIGTVRFDSVESEPEIFITGIIMNPEFYGRGCGSKILSLAVNYIIQNFPKKNLIAEIHKENIASIKIFSRNHFNLVDNSDVFAVYRLASGHSLLKSRNN